MGGLSSTAMEAFDARLTSDVVDHLFEDRHVQFSGEPHTCCNFALKSTNRVLLLVRVSLNF